MRPAREMAERMKNMLVRDKMGVGEGFSTALKGDIRNLLQDYFDLKEVEMKVELGDDGLYNIRIYGTATAVKSFSSTADMQTKRNI